MAALTTWEVMPQLPGRWVPAPVLGVPRIELAAGGGAVCSVGGEAAVVAMPLGVPRLEAARGVVLWGALKTGAGEEGDARGLAVLRLGGRTIGEERAEEGDISGGLATGRSRHIYYCLLSFLLLLLLLLPRPSRYVGVCSVSFFVFRFFTPAIF